MKCILRNKSQFQWIYPQIIVCEWWIYNFGCHASVGCQRLAGATVRIWMSSSWQSVLDKGCFSNFAFWNLVILFGTSLIHFPLPVPEPHSSYPTPISLRGSLTCQTHILLSVSSANGKLAGDGSEVPCQHRRTLESSNPWGSKWSLVKKVAHAAVGHLLFLRRRRIFLVRETSYTAFGTWGWDKGGLRAGKGSCHSSVFHLK